MHLPRACFLVEFMSKKSTSTLWCRRKTCDSFYAEIAIFRALDTPLWHKSSWSDPNENKAFHVWKLPVITFKTIAKLFASLYFFEFYVVKRRTRAALPSVYQVHYLQFSLRCINCLQKLSYNKFKIEINIFK